MIKTESRPTNQRSRTRHKSASRSKRTSSSRDPRRSNREGFASNQSRYEHYISLARNAALNGDAIEAENLLQHAEHYLRQMQD
ncbi:MAG: DUF4167 domain-containing protein [Hyphomicrobiaceae bacterium]